MNVPFTVTVQCTSMKDLKSFATMVIHEMGSSTGVPIPALAQASIPSQQAVTQLQPAQAAASPAPREVPGPYLPPSRTQEAQVPAGFPASPEVLTPAQVQRAIGVVAKIGDPKVPRALAEWAHANLGTTRTNDMTPEQLTKFYQHLIGIAAQLNVKLD